MRNKAYVVALALASALAASASVQAKSVESAQSKACWDRAAKEGLTGAKRSAYHATCMKGALAPRRPVRRPTTKASAAITAPSDADKATRSKECSDEATRRGLHDTGFQSFRQSCLATAAPVRSVGTGLAEPKPTAAKPKIEDLTNTPPH